MQEYIGDNIYLLIIFCTGGISLLVVSFVLLFIRNQRKLLASRQQAHDREMAHQQSLMHAMLASQEQERRRIGQDLHDEVGGALSNLRMRMGREDLDQYRQQIDGIIQSVRHIAHNLSPPALALFGFSAALEELVAYNGNFILLRHEAAAATDQLPHETALALLRILQELLSNTRKHAQATQVNIRLWVQEQQLHMDYADNGVGCDVIAGTGMGMRNIESRTAMIKANYTITSARGAGFAVHIWLPL
ncbi:MAG TPA: ATP-binding protein [Chitinophaga sp.]